MLEKIRSSYFETNSSSMDRYDDCDDYPHVAHVKQKVHIILKWKEDVSDQRVDEILDHIGNNEISDDLYKIFCDYYENADDLEIDNLDDGDITFVFSDCTVDISWSGGYYPATRYEPEEYPDMEIDDNDGVPEKRADYPGKERDKQAIMKIFQEKGWTEIIGVEDIYADEIDEDDVESAIN